MFIEGIRIPLVTSREPKNKPKFYLCGVCPRRQNTADGFGNIAQGGIVTEFDAQIPIKGYNHEGACIYPAANGAGGDDGFCYIANEVTKRNR